MVRARRLVRGRLPLVAGAAVVALAATGGVVGQADKARASMPATDTGVQSQAIPAFPGAEGFGAYASGGRGGSVYFVTTLADSGPGSFRDAVSQPNRTVVFAVGGIIRIGERISVAPNITIAGQTAPGEGITIYGNGLSFTDANNTITRYLRVRMGINGTPATDAISVARGDRMIFDHLSVTWGRDETFSVSAGDLNKPIEEQPSNITIQDSIMGQGLDTHSAGGLIETAGGISLLRNLYLDNDIRNPKVKGVNQYVNNVIYNWKHEAYILGGSQFTSRANVVNNYFIAGPSTVSGAFTRGNENFHLYASNNYHDNNRNGVLDGYVVPREEYTTVTWEDEPFPYPEVRTRSPQAAYRHVMKGVGASKHRDRVDKLLIEEVASLGTLGAIIRDENAPPINGPGPVRGGKAPVDTDLDGMPDTWELRVGLNPRVADNNGDRDGDGYTNLEEYLNGLVR
ncbi:pectate lyase family protein [Actinopolymorpha alba]|uniref:pectate lyase family protein n=1 Tax=Actinopolymorpha alba TaxID=533267 RepID=UPI0003A30FA7|nr:pectate lyase [Actinopolymorpha alba]